MSKLIAAAALTCLFAANFAFAQVPADAGAASGCEAKAMDKNGKALAGAARNSFMKKCEAAAHKEAAMAECANKAVSKDGKPLAGAAKNAFVKKCAMGAK